MSIHPFVRSEQSQDGTTGSASWQPGSEQWFLEEPEHMRPCFTFWGIAAIVAILMWFVIGCVAWAVFW